MHNPRNVPANGNQGKHGMASGLNGTTCWHCAMVVYHLATATGFTCPGCRTTQLAYPHVTGACGNSGVCMHN